MVIEEHVKEKKMKKKGFIVLLAAAFILAMVSSGPVLAQQAKVIELTYGSPYGADESVSKADQKWMAKIEKDTNGRVKIKPYFGGQIIGGANAVDEVAQGAADIGLINPLNSKTGFTICKASALFFAGATVESGARAFKELRTKFPEIDKEYTDAGIKPLQWISTTSELVARKPVRKLADMKGSRIKVLGDWSKVIKELGAEGLNSPASELYVSMQKGILDGATVPVELLEAMKLADVAK